MNTKERPCKTLAGIENIKIAGIKLQINTTITRKNLSELENIGALALKLGALSYHVFFWCRWAAAWPLEGDEISPLEYEEAFNRLYDFQRNFPLHIKPTCAPHYYRILRQRLTKEKSNQSFDLPDHGFHAVTKGCLAGQGVCFVSYKGEVFGCGYLPLAAGDLRKQTFREIWLESELLRP